MVAEHGDLPGGKNMSWSGLSGQNLRASSSFYEAHRAGRAIGKSSVKCSMWEEFSKTSATVIV